MAWRRLRRAPGHAIASIACLAVATAVAATQFAVLDGIRHPKAFILHPDRLWSVALDAGLQGPDVELERASLESSPSVEGAAALGRAGPGLAAPIRGAGAAADGLLLGVSANYFEVLGVRPLAGRLPRWRDGRTDEIVVTPEVWARLRGPTASFVSAPVTIAGGAYVVVGVVPPEAFTQWGNVAMLAAPAQFTPTLLIRTRSASDSALLVSSARAVALRVRGARGGSISRRPPQIRSLAENSRPVPAAQVALTLAAVLMVLLGALNAANLQVARVAKRKAELAVRSALGADLWTGIAELIGEALILVAISGIVAGVLAYWLVTGVLHAAPSDLGWLSGIEPRLTWRVALQLLCLLGGATIISAAVPAFVVSRYGDLAAADSRAGPGRAARRGNQVLGAVQIAGALALMIVAAVVVAGARRFSSFNFGYDPQSLVSATVIAPRGAPPIAVEGLLEALRNSAGAQQVTWSVPAPVEDRTLAFPESPGAKEHRLSPQGQAILVPDDFPHVLGVQLASGMLFVPGSAGAVVDQDAVDEYWDGHNPLGQFIKLGRLTGPGREIPVVGVVRRLTLERGLCRPGECSSPVVMVYDPTPTIRDSLSAVDVVVRVSGNATRAAESIQRSLRRASPDYLIEAEPWMEASGLGTFARMEAFLSFFFAALAALALSLGLLGIAGITGVEVRGRAREIGIRTALGASDGQVVRLFLRDNAMVMLAGCAVGLIVAVWLKELVSYSVTDLGPAEPLIIASGVVAVCLAVAVSTAIPVLRTTMLSPADALRAE